MRNITVEQIIPISVNPVTLGGRAAAVDGPVQFESLDESIVTILRISPNAAVVKPTGKLGTVDIRAKFDADLGEGVRMIEDIQSLEVVAAEAVDGTIVFGEPANETPIEIPDEPEPPTVEPPPIQEPTPPPVEEPTPSPPVPTPSPTEHAPTPPVFVLPIGETAPTFKYGPTVLNVRDFGALGDNKADDTAALMAAVKALPADGGTIDIPAGIYRIKQSQKSWLRSNLRLRAWAGAWLVGIEDDEPRNYILLAQGMNNVVFENIRVKGDRLLHKYVTFPPVTVNNPDGTTTTRPNANDTHEWGHGIATRGGCTDIALIGCDLQLCHGDGASLAGDRIFIYNTRALFNRRQGLTVGGATNVKMYSCETSDTGDYTDAGAVVNQGTMPMAGVDIEPDAPSDARNIRIWNHKSLRNRVGVEMYSNSKPAGTTADPDYAEVTDIEILDSEFGFNVLGLAMTRTKRVAVRGCYVHDQQAEGIKTISGVDGLELDGNRYERNYLRGGTPKSRNFTLAGTDSRTTKDILLQGTPKNVTFPTASSFN